MDARLVRLRVELFTAAQTLTGEDAVEFWKLIKEVASIEDLHRPAPGAGPRLPPRDSED